MQRINLKGNEKRMKKKQGPKINWKTKKFIDTIASKMTQMGQRKVNQPHQKKVMVD